MSSTTEQTNTLNSTLRRITQSPEYQRILNQLRSNQQLTSINGIVAGSARALVVAALQRETGKRFVVVAQSTRDLESWEMDLRFWYCALAGKENCDNEVLVIPASESDPYSGVSPHAQTLEKRALSLWRLRRHSADVVLLTSRAVGRRTVSPAEIEKAGEVLRRDHDYPPEELVEKLIATGYVREDPVSGVGEFSSRGGILDIWPPGNEWPVRLEFFGDTLDSLREFDPETQLSTNQLREIEIPPMHEYAVDAGDFRLWAEAARERWSDSRYARSLRDRTAFADEGEAFTGWEWLIPIISNVNSNIFDHLGDCVLVVDEPASVEMYLSEVYENLAIRYAEIEQADDIALSPSEIYLSPDELRTLLQRQQRVELRTLGRAAAELDQDLVLDAEAPKIQIGRTRAPRQPLFLFPASEPGFEIEWQAQSTMRYHGRVSDLANEVKRSAEENGTTLFVLPSLGVAERINEILAEYDVASRLSLVAESSETATAIPAVITVGRISSGFGLP